MPLSILVIMNVLLVVAAVLQCLGPLYARPGLFFGVTVDPAFPGSENGRRILWLYRRPVVVMTALCIAALWLAIPRLGGIAAPIAVSALVFLQVGAAIASMAGASRHVRPFAKLQTTTRTVSVLPRKRSLPGGWFPLFGPMLIVGVVGLLLFMRRNSVPPETYDGAFALLIVPFVTNVFFMWMAWLALFRTRQINAAGPAAIAESADRRFAYCLRLLVAYFQTVLMVAAVLAVARITPVVRGPGFMLTVMALWLVLVAFLLVYTLKRRRSAPDIPGAAIGDTTPDAAWKWGLFYYNPDDPALIVETRASRFGADLNFGK